MGFRGVDLLRRAKLVGRIRFVVGRIKLAVGPVIFSEDSEVINVVVWAGELSLMTVIVVAVVEDEPEIESVYYDF